MEKKDIEDSYIVLLILQPMLPPPVDMVGDTSTVTTGCSGGNLWESSSWSSSDEKGVTSPSRSSSSGGTNPSLNGILGLQPVTLVVNEVKEEGFYHYLLILSQGEDLSSMIARLVRNQGGTLVPRVNTGSWRDALSVPSVRNKITMWYRSDNEEAVNEGVGILTISVMNAARHKEIKIIPSRCEWWQLL